MDVQAYGWWEEASEGLEREDFLARYGHPFLLVYDPLEDPDVLDTGKIIALRPVRRTPVVPPPGSPVFPVVKQPKVGNVFPDMITVGRARNNDIVLPSSEVSNFHAYLACDGETWSLHDADSANGTFVGAERIDSPRALGDSEPVAFARVRARFVRPSVLWSILRGELEGS